jgi:hypothetical protein
LEIVPGTSLQIHFTDRVEPRRGPHVRTITGKHARTLSVSRQTSEHEDYPVTIQFFRVLINNHYRNTVPKRQTSQAQFRVIAGTEPQILKPEA